VCLLEQRRIRLGVPSTDANPPGIRRQRRENAWRVATRNPVQPKLNKMLGQIIMTNYPI
jgi:hypothetical protein